MEACFQPDQCFSIYDISLNEIPTPKRLSGGYITQTRDHQKVLLGDPDIAKNDGHGPSPTGRGLDSERRRCEIEEKPYEMTPREEDMYSLPQEG